MTDPANAFWTAAIGSPTVIALMGALFRGSILRNLKNIDDNIKTAIDMATKAQQGVQDLSMRLAVQGERFDALNQAVGELKGQAGKLSDRIDGVASHYRERMEKLEGK